MTTAGEPVTALDGAAKRPYETLLIGRVGATAVGDDAASPPRRDDASPLPDDLRIIVSVPSSVHSQKPPLSCESCDHTITALLFVSLNSFGGQYQVLF